VGERFSASIQTGGRAHPAPYNMGTGSFSRVKPPGRGINDPLPYSAYDKERVELLSLLHLWALMACYRVKYGM